jgi:ATPase subunit of ABC transporter with duplicated ATPase domains
VHGLFVSDGRRNVRVAMVLGIRPEIISAMIGANAGGKSETILVLAERKGQLAGTFSGGRHRIVELSQTLKCLSAMPVD